MGGKALSLKYSQRAGWSVLSYQLGICYQPAADQCCRTGSKCKGLAPVGGRQLQRASCCSGKGPATVSLDPGNMLCEHTHKLLGSFRVRLAEQNILAPYISCPIPLASWCLVYMLNESWRAHFSSV